LTGVQKTRILWLVRAEGLSSAPALCVVDDRMRLAHADLTGLSVFEEASQRGEADYRRLIWVNNE
jgi:hypothetical protein